MAKLCFAVYRNFVTADGLGHAGHGKSDRLPPLVRLVVGRNRTTKPFSFRRLASIDRAHLNLTLGTFQLLKTTQKLSESFLQTPRRTKVPSDQNEVLEGVTATIPRQKLRRQDKRDTLDTQNTATHTSPLGDCFTSLDSTHPGATGRENDRPTDKTRQIGLNLAPRAENKEINGTAVVLLAYRPVPPNSTTRTIFLHVIYAS